MFKKFAGYAVLTAMALVSGNVLAGNDARHGVGLIAGRDTVISYRYQISKVDKLLVSTGWNDNDFSAGLDFQRHSLLPQKKVTSEMSYYYGVGVQMTLQSGDDEILARVPLGIDITPVEVPMTFFAELAPGVAFDDGTRLKLNGALGLIYSFSL